MPKADTNITVRVRLFATLKKYLPPESGDAGVMVKLPHGSTVHDVIDKMGIPRDFAGMIVSGDTYLEGDSVLGDGQEVSLFPPLAGGAPQLCKCGEVDI